MPLNKVNGNMYEFLNENGKGFTWNAVKGKCPHECSYCYMKRFPQKSLHFDDKELKTDLGNGNFIFVGSSCDMWATGIDSDWIRKIIDHCKEYPNNKYLFQSKNPIRFGQFQHAFPLGTILVTTIESNINYQYQIDNFSVRVPSVEERARELWKMKVAGFKTAITIEPIMQFDLFNFVNLIKTYYPDWINIGADSGNNRLEEPSADSVKELIIQLQQAGLVVKQKSNLSRLLIR